MEDSGEIEDSFLDDSTFPETPPISPPASSDDEIQAAFKNEAKDDVVEIVGEVKPRNLRTPEIIDISSASEIDLEQKDNISEPIEISSKESEEMENLRKSLIDRCLNRFKIKGKGKGKGKNRQ